MKILLATMFAVFSATVAAQDRPFYVGGHIGQSKAESTCDGVSGNGISCDDKGSALKVFGGYRLHQNIAAEITFADLGEAKATGPAGSITASSNAFDLSVVGSYSPLNRLSLYGRLGVYRANTEVRINTVTVNRTDRETNTGMVYGFGVGYDITKRVTVRAEWQKYNEVGGPSTGEDDISFLSVGALFRF